MVNVSETLQTSLMEGKVTPGTIYTRSLVTLNKDINCEYAEQIVVNEFLIIKS